MSPDPDQSESLPHLPKMSLKSGPQLSPYTSRGTIKLSPFIYSDADADVILRTMTEQEMAYTLGTNTPSFKVRMPMLIIHSQFFRALFSLPQPHHQYTIHPLILMKSKTRPVFPWFLFMTNGDLSTTSCLAVMGHRKIVLIWISAIQRKPSHWHTSMNLPNREEIHEFPGISVA